MRNCHSGIIPVRGMSIKFVILLILWRGVILPSPPPTPITNVDNVTYQKPESPSVTHQNNFSQLLTASHEKSSLCSKSRHSVLLQQTFATRMMKKKARILFPSQLFWNLKRKQAYGMKSYLQNNNRYKETYFFNANLWDKDCMSKLELHPKICWYGKDLLLHSTIKNNLKPTKLPIFGKQCYEDTSQELALYENSNNIYHAGKKRALAYFKFHVPTLDKTLVLINN